MKEKPSRRNKQTKDLPKIIFHRANSLALCQKGLEAGVEMIEFDVRRTKDQVLITFHDLKVKKQKVGDLTYAELKELAEDQEIPTLEEVLRFLSGKVKVDVELKEIGYEKEVMEEVFRFFDPSDIVATSFWITSVRKLKSLYPHLQVGMLVAKRWPEIPYTGYIPVLLPLRKTIKAGADFVAPHYHFLKMGILRRAKKKGIPVYLWTVNQKEMVDKLVGDPRVRGIITDEPLVALEARKVYLEKEKKP